MDRTGTQNYFLNMIYVALSSFGKSNMPILLYFLHNGAMHFIVNVWCPLLKILKMIFNEFLKHGGSLARLMLSVSKKAYLTIVLIFQTIY